MGINSSPPCGHLLITRNHERGYEMKITNHETKNLFASSLTGVALAVVLGSMVALSTSAFAMGGGGGGGGSAPAPAPAPAPEITKVDDPVVDLGDEVAEVRNPVVDPGGEIPDGKTPVSESRTKEPEEKTLTIEDPDEDKPENKPDERTTDFPKPKVVEATVGFAASASSVAEEGGSSEMRVRISKALPQPVVLSVSAAGTATEGVDYKISSASLRIPAGATVGTITVIGLDDDLDEVNETITLTLAGTLPEGVTLGTTAHTVTIIDDDVTEVTVGFVRQTTQMKEGEAASLQVVLSGPFSQPVAVTLSEGDDGLELSPGTVTFQPGETSKVVRLTAVEDDDSADERVIVYLGGAFPDGVKYGEIHGHIVTITDDEVSGTVGFASSGNDTTASEGDTVRLTVASSVAPAAGSSVSFDWSVSPASEVGNAGGRVTIVGPATTGTFAINVADDGDAEIEERITITLSDGNPNDLFALDGNVTHTITIPANDNTITFSAPSSASITEEGGIATITATINNPIPVSKAATVTVIPHGSALRGSDYEFSVSGGSLIGNTWTLPAGMSSATLTVTAVGNSVDAENKTLTLGFAGASLPVGWSVGQTHTHTVTIVDDDVAEVDETLEVVVTPGDETDTETEDKTVNKPDERTVEFPNSGDDKETTEVADETPEPVVSVIEFEVSESKMLEGEGKVVILEAQITPPVSKEISLDYDYSGSANRGNSLSYTSSLYDERPSADYAILWHNVRIPANVETAEAVQVLVFDDAIEEGDEAFTVTMRGRLPEGVEFGNRNHTITITDDDVSNKDVIVGFANSVSSFDEDVGSLAVEVVLSESLDEPLTVGYDTEPPPLTFKKDGKFHLDENVKGGRNRLHRRIITFQPGETSKSFLIDINDDRLDEAWSAYTVLHLSGKLPEGVKFGRKTHTYFNYDNDPSNSPVTSDRDGLYEVDYDGSGIELENDGNVVKLEAVHYNVEDAGILIENSGVVTTDMKGVNHALRNVGVISIKNGATGEVGGNVIGKHHGDGRISIENRGTVDGDIRAVQFRDGATEIVNHGNVGERMEVTHYGAGDISITNGETATATEIAANHYGSGEISIVNHGTTEVSGKHEGDNGVVRFAGNVSSGSWNELRGGAIHLGVVDFRRSVGEDISTLEIYGDYEGSGDTQLNFHVGANGMDYGHLWIEGDITGQSRVSLVVDGEVAADADFDLWELIGADGEAQANNFYGAETVGAFDYVLEYERKGSGDHAWHFVNRGLSEVATKSSQTVDEIIKNMITPTATNPGEREEYWCLWGEQLGSHTVLGFEVPVTRLAGGDMFVGTSVARNSSISNNVSVESQITALAANWERGGLYVGGQTRLARFTSDVSTGRLSVVQNNGGTGISMSVETGYWFDVMNFRVSPQAQLTWTRVGFDDFVGPHGELVSLEDGDRVTGQLGLSWDGEWQDAEGFGRLYGGVNLRGNLDGRTSVNVSGVSITNEQDDLSMDGKLGFSYEWNEGYAVHGEVSALRGDDTEEIRADLGVRIDF